MIYDLLYYIIHISYYGLSLKQKTQLLRCSDDRFVDSDSQCSQLLLDLLELCFDRRAVYDYKTLETGH